MARPPLIIAGITLPILSYLDLDQTMDPIKGGSRSRLSDGAMFGMRRWGHKWRTTLSGKGWIPAPLLTIDYDAPFDLHCVRPLTLLDGQTLPNGWVVRADVPEVVRVIDGVNVRFVYPIIQVWSDPPRFVPGVDATWELICEEA